MPREINLLPFFTAKKKIDEKKKEKPSNTGNSLLLNNGKSPWEMALDVITKCILCPPFPHLALQNRIRHPVCLATAPVVWLNLEFPFRLACVMFDKISIGIISPITCPFYDQRGKGG